MLHQIVGWLAAFDAGSPLRPWLLVFAVGVGFEVLLPRVETGHSLLGYWRSFVHVLIYMTILFFSVASVYDAVSAARARFGIGPLIRLDFISNDTVAAQIALALMTMFVSDFFIYWWHRAQHTFPVLWDQHVVHHATEELNILASTRHHCTEFMFQEFLVGIPMGVLFKITPVGMGAVSTIMGFWANLIHCNVRVELGSLSWLMTTPQMHRLHHSRLPQHVNKDLATYFPIYDIIFGTYCVPCRGEYPPTGVEGIRIETVAALSLHPFRCWIKRISTILWWSYANAAALYSALIRGPV